MGRFSTATPDCLIALEAAIGRIKDSLEEDITYPYPFTQSFLPPKVTETMKPQCRFPTNQGVRPSSSQATVAADVDAAFPQFGVPKREETKADVTATSSTDDGARKRFLLAEKPAASGAAMDVATVPEVYPRVLNEWGTTICPDLLLACPLLVCKVTRADLTEEVEILARCAAEEGVADGWNLSILAAPKRLLVLRGEQTRARCLTHGGNMHLAPVRDEIDYYRIEACLHPTGPIASIFWNKIAEETWSGVCQDAVQTVLRQMNLDSWQFPVMQESIKNVQQQFHVKQGQIGFFTRTKRPGEQMTLEERQRQQDVPYEETRKPVSRRTRRNKQVVEENLEPQVWRVVQDLLRVVHHMLPLGRIRKQAGLSRNVQACWQHTSDGAYQFANSDRVMVFLACGVQPFWFHTGDDGQQCRFGLKAEYIPEAIAVVKAWMLPRVTRNQSGDAEAEKMSWRWTLWFLDFEMTEEEVSHMAAAAIAILHVRWHWISAWLQTEKIKLAS